MTAQRRVRLLQIFGLLLWMLLHAAGVCVAWFLWPPISVRLPWVILVLVGLVSPIYIYLIHFADTRWMMGGVLSTQRYLEDGRSEAGRESVPNVAPDPRVRDFVSLGFQLRLGETDPRCPFCFENTLTPTKIAALRGNQQPIEGASDRNRPGMARQTITITTGFAALLAFQAVRFYRDISKDNWPAHFLTALIITIAGFFILACCSNLVQIQLHQLLAQRIWEKWQKDTFRDKLNVLRLISWNSLLVAIILILCILPYPLVWTCFAANLLYGLMLYHYYFLKPRPGLPSLGGEVVSVDSARGRGAEATPASRASPQPRTLVGSRKRQSFGSGIWGATLLTCAILFWHTSRQKKN